MLTLLQPWQRSTIISTPCSLQRQEGSTKNNIEKTGQRASSKLLYLISERINNVRPNIIIDEDANSLNSSHQKRTRI
jgi:hypothetical protein